jgi:transcriptional repressor NrdR
MHCPFCQHEETKVIDSRMGTDPQQVRRRRQCCHCQTRFTTYESAELSLPKIIKRDKRRVAFDEHKLYSGIQRALEKRPISVATMDHIIADIKKKLVSLGEREVSSQLLGEWVMNALKTVDEVAYVRFASVYRRFQDINAFYAELKRIKQDKVKLS